MLGVLRWRTIGLGGGSIRPCPWVTIMGKSLLLTCREHKLEWKTNLGCTEPLINVRCLLLWHKLILTDKYSGRCNDYSHFINQESETQRCQVSCQDHTARQSWDCYPNHLNFKAYVLTILLMINQMLVIQDPIHRPQRKMALTKSHWEEGGLQNYSYLSDTCLQKEFRKMLQNRFSL